MLFAPALLSGAVILCAAIGFAVTQLSASHIAAQEHAALQRALDAFQGATGDVQDVNATELRLIEHSAGLKDLRFDVGPANEAGRELQSLHDARGRIIGWFSWIADNALAHAIDRLWALLAVIGACLVSLVLLPHGSRGGCRARSIAGPRPRASRLATTR